MLKVQIDSIISQKLKGIPNLQKFQNFHKQSCFFCSNMLKKVILNYYSYIPDIYEWNKEYSHSIKSWKVLSPDESFHFNHTHLFHQKYENEQAFKKIASEKLDLVHFPVQC